MKIQSYDINEIYKIYYRNSAGISSICDSILKADKVVIIAVGLSKMIGEYFSKLLIQVNKPTFYVYESHIIDLIPNMIQRDDLVVFISSSVETKTIVNVAEKLKYQHQQTVAITNKADCTLAKLVTVALSAHTQTVRYAGYDLTVRSVLMILIDLLTQSYLNRIQDFKK
jgi:DNA-binding MurR/RpiR family transcriptional regulator